MSLLIERLQTPSNSVSLSPPLFPVLIKSPKRTHRVTFRLTPQIRYKERTPSVFSISNDEWQVDLNDYIIESNLISFEEAMSLVKNRAADDNQRSHSNSLLSNKVKHNKTFKSEADISTKTKGTKNSSQKSSTSGAHSATPSKLNHTALNSARSVSKENKFKKIYENAEHNKQSARLKEIENTRAKEIEEGFRKRAEKIEVLEREKKNRLLKQQKAEEERIKKELIDEKRKKLEKEAEQKAEIDRLKKIEEIKLKKRLAMEAKQIQNFNIDYTADRKEIKLKKVNENISATEKALRLEAKKEAERVAKIRQQEEIEREKERERRRFAE